MLYINCICTDVYWLVLHLFVHQALAAMVTDEHLAEGRVYPPLSQVRNISAHLAADIVEYAYRHGMAAHYPEPEDKLQFVRDYQYNSDYESFIPVTYSWPGMPE